MVNPAFNPGMNPLGKPNLKSAINTKPNLSLRTAQDGGRSKMEPMSKQTQKVEAMGAKKVDTRPTARAERPRRNRPTPNPVFDDSSTSSKSSSSDSFQNPSQRAIFYDDRRDAPVTFDISVDNTLCIQPLEQVLNLRGSKSNPQMSTKFMLNLATYTRKDIGGTGSLSGYPVFDYYRTLFAQMERKVLATVRSKIIDDFTFENFYDYIQVLTRSLELYYFLDALLSYRSDTKDKNSGVILLQTGLSDSALFVKQNELRRALKAHWFPEKFSQLIRWTFQIYKTGDLHQACNYMFAPIEGIVDFDTSSEYIVGKYIANIDTCLLDLLNSDGKSPQFPRMASVLCQIFPEGMIEGLPLSCSTATYDPQHYEVFINQPITYNYSVGSTEETKYYPEMIGSLGEVVYAIGCEPGTKSSFPFCLQNIQSSAVNWTTDFFRVIHYTRELSKSDDGNKFTMTKFTTEGSTDVKYTFTNRLSNRFISNESADVHTYDRDYGTTDLNPVHKWSVPKSGFQRAYFDTPNAPLINLRSMMDSLFGFI